MNRQIPALRAGPLRTTRRGFTLIELLLVLVILSVLAVVVVPKFAGRSLQAKIAAAKMDIAAIEKAIDAFEVECDGYPTNSQGLKALIDQPAGEPGWNGSYLKKRVLPKDPWKNPYVYQFPGKHNIDGYDLYSTGPDSNEGGGDDIDNWSGS